MEYLHKNIIEGHPILSSYLNVYGVQNPFNLKWAEENESSFSLVSEINNMSILVSMMKDNAPNLFLI